MNNRVFVGLLAGALLLVGGWYYWRQGGAEALPPPPPVATSAITAPAPATPSAPAAAPTIRYPLPAALMTSPAPGDTSFLQSLRDWLGRKALALLFDDELIVRIVKTVDYLPRQMLPADAMPLRPVAGVMLTAGSGEALVISRRNAARYNSRVEIVRQLDVGRLVALYAGFYPQFQRTYEDLTGANAYFNDRLVEAIDDLLAAPEPSAPLGLVRANGTFEFADPDLAARSVGQKIILRLGTKNSAVIRTWLRELRQELTRGVAGPRTRNLRFVIPNIYAGKVLTGPA